MNHRGLAARAMLAVAAVWGSFAAAPAARADEGMWTFDNFPAQRVAKAYGFAPSKAWLDRVRAASLRLTTGCSASFISPHGLVMTNDHCVVDCVEALSAPQQNVVDAGFSAKVGAEEKTCPNFELDQLIGIRDVTDEVEHATAGKTGAAATAALHAIEATLQATCGSDPVIRCDVVSLYGGGVDDLYRYRRYTDVRLVFAPENAVGQFGGDLDNFNFPRYHFDIGLLRVYDDGKPLANNAYLKWSANGSKPDELVFAAGNPAGTNRQTTVSQLTFARDRAYPESIPELAEYRGLLEQLITRGPDQARAASEPLSSIENDFKVVFGAQSALLDPRFFARLVADEQRLRAAVGKRRALATADGSAWNDITAIQTIRGELFTRTRVLGNFMRGSDLLGDALTLVDAAAERAKPNDARLPEYTDQALVRVERRLDTPVPISKDLEELRLTHLFTIAQRDLGADDPFAHALLAGETPGQLAHRLVAGTQLDDPKVRAALYAGGGAAIAASTDPMIRFAMSIDPELRAARRAYDDRVTAPTRAAAERIAAARFAIDGRTVAPDATFSPRLSYGTVKGFVNAAGDDIAPYTTIGGLFAHATGAAPFALPQSWLGARSALDPSTPMNLSCTIDESGGGSGSPLIDADAHIVGLIFDGNRYALGGIYGYDAARNRAIAVDSRALLAGLHAVYHLDGIVAEIESAR
jgi:hypothetical protein